MPSSPESCVKIGTVSARGGLCKTMRGFLLSSVQSASGLEGRRGCVAVLEMEGTM